MDTVEPGTVAEKIYNMFGVPYDDSLDYAYLSRRGNIIDQFLDRHAEEVAVLTRQRVEACEEANNSLEEVIINLVEFGAVLGYMVKEQELRHV